MEDIVQFLIIAAFIAITIVGKSKKKKEMEEETYPEFPDDLGDEEDDAVKTEVQSEPGMFCPAPKSVVNKHKNKRNNKKRQEEPKVTTPPTVVTQQNENATDLRSPRKAREAFIHSIIFERKYQ